MPSNKPEKDWNALVANAREARPPWRIDVRAQVLQTILAGEEPATLWEDVSRLAGTMWMRGLLGGGALAAIPLLSYAAQAGRDLLDILHLAAPMVTGF